MAVHQNHGYQRYASFDEKKRSREAQGNARAMRGRPEYLLTRIDESPLVLTEDLRIKPANLSVFRRAMVYMLKHPVGRFLLYPLLRLRASLRALSA